MDDTIESRIKLGYQAVKEQTEYFSRQFGQVASKWKLDGSRVTEADIHLSHVFADIIIEAFEGDQFFSEELDHGSSPLPLNSEYAWLLDPIDGTNNFARSIATCSISLALLKDGSPVYGYIYDHSAGKLIHGGPGKGLFLDDEPQQQRETLVNAHSVISTQALSTEDAARDDSSLQMRFKMRAMGSSALHMAYAALGWTDGVIAHRVKSWDIAAGMALLAAVGGSTRFFDTKVFPLKEFSSSGSGFGHIAGSNEMCDTIEEAIGRKCAFRF